MLFYSYLGLQLYNFNIFIKPYLNLIYKLTFHCQHNVLALSPDNNKKTPWYCPENETRDIGSSGQAINLAGGQPLERTLLSTMGSGEWAIN